MDRDRLKQGGRFDQLPFNGQVKCECLKERIHALLKMYVCELTFTSMVVDFIGVSLVWKIISIS